MSDKRQEFLEAIIADPDDDMARLVFADWLEENHDYDRAEFIRVQIERTQLPEWDARQIRLQLRDRALLKKNENAWRAELPEISGINWGEFRRGFVSVIHCHDFKTMDAKVPECRNVIPIEALFIKWPRRDSLLDELPSLPGLRDLTMVGSQIHTQEVVRLAESPLLSTLRSLNVSQSALGVKGFRRLLASPHLGNLRSLNAGINSIGNGGPTALAKAKSLTVLEELDLSEAGSYGRYGEDPIMESSGLEELVAWPGIRRLRSLTLCGNDIGQSGLQTLLSSSKTAGLKKLVVSDNNLDGQAMLEFGFAHEGVKLEVLGLDTNWLDNFGASNLSSATCLDDLKVLNLNACEIDEEGAVELANAAFMTNLHRLDVTYNNFGPKGFRALLDAAPKKLHTLNMENNGLTHSDLDYLAKSPASNVFQELNLSGNFLGAAVAKSLAQSNYLKQLLVLKLNNNAFDKTDAFKLAESPLGKRLEVLEGLDHLLREPVDTPEGDIPF